MALPIVMLYILVAVTLAIFIFGASRQSANSGFIFIALSAVILIVTGLFMWTSGLQTDTIASWDTSSSTAITPTYQTLTVTDGSPLWVVVNLFVYGGIALILIAFVLTVRARRADARQKQIDYQNSI